jgi:hypothetical protein
MAQDNDFSGRWHFVYWYPSNHHEGEEPSEYYGKISYRGRELIFESGPTEAENYMLSRLSLDDNLATGTWYEKSSPHGFFAGMEYSGAGQLLFDQQSMEFKGMWAGIGLDRKANKPKIYTGRWEIKKA